jgi:hypothetical protein
LRLGELRLPPVPDRAGVGPLLTIGLRGAALAFREPRLYRASARSVVSRSLSWFLSLSRCASTRASASLTRCFSLVISSKVDILIPRPSVPRSSFPSPCVWLVTRSAPNPICGGMRPVYCHCKARAIAEQIRSNRPAVAILGLGDHPGHRAPRGHQLRKVRTGRSAGGRRIRTRGPTENEIFVWDTSATVEDAGMQKLPLGKGSKAIVRGWFEGF